SGKFEDDKTVLRIAGNKLDVDKFAYRIAANVDETTKEKNLKVRSLESKLPESIKTGLYDFAKLIDKPTEELSDKDLIEFQLTRMPEIIRKGLLPDEVNIVSGSKVQKDSNKEIELKLMASQRENEELKTQLKTLKSEVKILTESKKVVEEIQTKASQANTEVVAKHI